MHVHARRLTLLICLALPSAAWADPRDDARRHFQTALRAAAQEDFRGAVDAFLAAYAAIPHPVTAFNIGRTYQNLGDLEDALFWFRKVVDLDPERAAEVQPILDDLERTLRPPPEPAPQEDTEDPVERLAQIERERAALMAQLGLSSGDRADVESPDPGGAVEVPAVSMDVEAPDDRVDDPIEGSGDDEDASAAPLLGLSGDDPYQQVIVTASRYGQDPLDSPQSVTVLSGDAIRRSGAVHIADALRRVVGVDMMSMSSGVPWLGIRNFNTEMNNKVLWLVDGRPAMLAFLGTALPFTLGVTIEEIERVEVIRGPGSAIYGANAVTGVINIITRRPGEGPAFEAVGQYGNNEYARSSAVASGTAGRVRYRMSAGYQQEGRFERELEDPSEAPNVVPFRSDDLGDRRVHLGARLDTTFADKGWASVSGSWNTGFAEYYSKAALGNFGLDGEFGTVRGDLSYGPFHARAFYQREAGRTRSWLSSSGQQRSTEARVQNDLANVQLEGDFKAQTGQTQHRFLVGTSYEFRLYRAGQEGFGFEIPRTENHFAGFAHYTMDYLRLSTTYHLKTPNSHLRQA